MAIRNDWTSERLALCTPDRFHVRVRLDKPDDLPLTEVDLDRLDVKLGMVEEIAAEFAARMLKGVLKYTADSDSGNTKAEWLAHARDEAFDLVNYLVLESKAES